MKTLLTVLLVFAFPTTAKESKASCEADLLARQFIQDLASKSSEPEIYVDWPETLTTYSRKMRRAILSEVRHVYPKLEKFPIDPTQPYPIAPKRAVDTAVAMLRHPFPYFRRQNRLEPVRETYQRYIAWLQHQTLVGTPGYAAYDCRHLIQAYQAIQKEFIKYHQDHPDQNPPTLFIAGSLPNGRAHATLSDVDASISPRDEDLINTVEYLINENLGHSAGFALKISPFDIGSKGHLAWNGQVSPINVYITAEYIELWVYPIMPELPHRVYLDGWPIPPDKYRL